MASLQQQGKAVDIHSLTHAYEDCLRQHGILPLNDTLIYLAVLAQFKQQSQHHHHQPLTSGFYTERQLPSSTAAHLFFGDAFHTHHSSIQFTDDNSATKHSATMLFQQQHQSEWSPPTKDCSESQDYMLLLTTFRRLQEATRSAKQYKIKREDLLKLLTVAIQFH